MSALLAQLGTTRARFAGKLAKCLMRGEQLAVYGPRGIGKTTLVTALARDFKRRRMPCAVAARTNALSDVTEALGGIYHVTGDVSIAQRYLRSRLRSVTEQQCGVLLLDHVTNVTLAMRSFLRSLRGGLVGVAFIVDVDTKKEHARMRSWHLGHTEFEMPRMSALALQQLLQDERWFLGPRTRELVLHASRGRPSFIIQCIQLATQREYWKDGRLLVNTLCTDAEMITRGMPDGIEPWQSARQHFTQSQGES